jgi:hypothetical protein
MASSRTQVAPRTSSTEAGASSSTAGPRAPARTNSTVLETGDLVLGTGKRLFDATSDRKRFRLADSRTVAGRVAILVYQRAPRNAEAASRS